MSPTVTAFFSLVSAIKDVNGSAVHVFRRRQALWLALEQTYGAITILDLDCDLCLQDRVNAAFYEVKELCVFT